MKFKWTQGYIIVAILILCGGSVLAQSVYSLREITPDVQTALDSRRDRFEQISVLKSENKVGENNRGYLTALVEDADVQAVVEAENSDRKTVYQTIGLQNGIEEQMDAIEQVFAKVQRDKLTAGERYQMQDGSWATQEK